VTHSKIAILAMCLSEEIWKLSHSSVLRRMRLEMMPWSSKVGPFGDRFRRKASGSDLAVLFVMKDCSPRFSTSSPKYFECLSFDVEVWRMRKFFVSVREIAVAGFFFLLPAYIVVIVAIKAWTALSSLGSRVAAMFGMKSVLGVALRGFHRGCCSS
jgi:hypothetical protein